MGVIEASDRAWKVAQMTNEKQSAAEWLRGIIEKYEADGARSCLAMAEMFGVVCKEETCLSCMVKMMTVIAKRFESERALPEGIEWPRFEDGELVKIGDELEFEGKTMLVCDATFYADDWALWCDREDMSGRLYGKYGERVKHPAPKVLDAAGVEIKVGDTVYCDDDPEQLTVDSFEDPGCVYLTLAKSPNGMLYTVEPSRLTHERPDSWERIEEDAKLAPRDYLEKRGMNPEKTERIASMMADLVRRAKALSKGGQR